MAIGVVGRKCGMTRVFNEDGSAVPVTVVEVTPNRVTQVKTVEIDGYRAVQVAIGTRKPSRVNKPLAEQTKVTLFDSTLDAADPEKYATSFPIHSLAS